MKRPFLCFALAPLVWLACSVTPAQGEIFVGTLDIQAGGTFDVGTYIFSTTTSGTQIRQYIVGGQIVSQQAGAYDEGEYRIGWASENDLVVVGYTIAGDSNVDGDVDNADIARTFLNYTGSTGSGMDWASGDYNYDGDVDNADIATVFQNYTGSGGGLNSTTELLSIQAIPEPGMLGLLSAGVLALFRRRRGS